MCNSNKQQLILTKFNTNNAPFIGNRSAKFQLNLLKQNNIYSGFCKVTPKTLQFQVCVSNVIHKDLKLKCFKVTLQKPL